MIMFMRLRINFFSVLKETLNTKCASVVWHIAIV